MTSKHQEVTIYKGQQFAVAEHGGDVAAVLADVLAPGEQLSLSSFPAIKIPAGGGLAWTLPDGEPAKEIQCVILHRQPVRAFWREAFSGEGNPPDCTSIDNLIGQGDPGGECATCPLNEWGSGSESGKACRQITRLFVLLPESQLPILLPLPPSSYKAAQSYALNMAGMGRRYYGVVSAISLLQDKSRGGITYSKAAFRTVAPLDATAAAGIAAYRERMLPYLTAAPITQAEASEEI